MGARSVIYAAALVLALLAGTSGANAAEATSGRVPVPAPPKGKGEKCVADTPYIRRYHMMLLMHQRDDTVHEGIRTKRFSLKQCVDCHAVNGADGKPVAYDNPAHFCRRCHDYAAVSIDCFECHDSKPQRAAGMGNAMRQSAMALGAYLKEHGR